LGEGGMLVVNREEWIDSVPGFRHYGMRAFGPDRERYWVPAMGNVDFDWDGVWPYNFCIGEVQCALGTLLLDRVDAMNQLRRSRAGRIQEALRAYPELQFQTVPEGRTSVWHLLAARYDGDRFGRTRDNLMELMAFTHKVQVVVQYYPLNRYPMFEKAGLGVADCPNTDRFFDNMVSFPFNHHLSEAQIDYMINAIRSSLETLRGEMA
jgi:dTDP-4-amino-4,6-dideoxygalactose transaminase